MKDRWTALPRGDWPGVRAGNGALQRAGRPSTSGQGTQGRKSGLEQRISSHPLFSDADHLDLETSNAWTRTPPAKHYTPQHERSTRCARPLLLEGRGSAWKPAGEEQLLRPVPATERAVLPPFFRVRSHPVGQSPWPWETGPLALTGFQDACHSPGLGPLSLPHPARSHHSPEGQTAPWQRSPQ